MPTTTYNNKSKYYKNWTSKKLKEEAAQLNELIYTIECYGIKNILRLNHVLFELKKRGIEPKNKLNF